MGNLQLVTRVYVCLCVFNILTCQAKNQMFA